MGNIDRSIVEDVAAYLPHWLEARRLVLAIPGIQAAIYHEDQMVMSVALGKANLEHDISLTTDHIFRVASQSKWVTAIAVMQLSQAGRLNLDDQIGRYIPWLGTPTNFPDIAEVTVGELLSHESGIAPNGLDADWNQLKARPTLEELPGQLDQLLVSFEPRGRRFIYSNVGYMLLGLVVAGASGISYNEYVATKIIAPLKLTKTEPEFDPQREAEFATGYTQVDLETRRRTPTPLMSTGALSSGGGLCSTAEEMCRIAATFFPGDERLLNAHSKQIMQDAKWKDLVQPGVDYGAGMWIFNLGTLRIQGHPGSIVGFVTHTTVDPNAQIAAAAFTNATEGTGRFLALEMFGLLAVVMDKVGPYNPAMDLDKYCGRFETIWGVTDIVRFGDQLFAVDPLESSPGQTISELHRESEGSFVLTTNHFASLNPAKEKVEYAFGSNGKPTHVRIKGLSAFPPEEFRRKFLAGGVAEFPS